MDVLSYRLELDFSRTDGLVVLRAEVEFRVPAPIDCVAANLNVDQLRRITLNGVELATAMYADGRLRLSDLRPVNRLWVEAEISDSDDGHGLCRYVDRDDDAERHYVHSKLFRPRVPTPAARLLPCFDGAGRAPIEVSVIAPAGWSCVSNGRVVDQPPAGEAGRWRFARTLPLSPQQLTVAAGPWTEVRSSAGAEPALESISYGRQSVTAQVENSPIGRLVADCAAAHAQALGVPYPFDNLAVVFVPGYASLGGSFGGIILLNESLLEASLDPAERRYVLWAVAHETAHAWFGGLTGPASCDGWLSEGLATYLGHLAMQSLAPELHPWPAFQVIEGAGAHRADTRPDTASVINANHPSIRYSKPAALLRQLSTEVGETAVRAGIRLWLERNAFTESTSADLVRALAEATGADLAGWAETWLATPGVNTLELRLDAAPDGRVRSARIVQQPTSPGGILRSHRLGLAGYDLTPEGLAPRDRFVIRVSGAATEVPQLIGQPVPALVVPNAPSTTYARVRLDKRSRAALHDHLGDLPPDERAVCWVAAKEMVDDGLLPRAEFIALINRFGAAEPDPSVADMITARRSRPGLDPGWETWTADHP